MSGPRDEKLPDESRVRRLARTCWETLPARDWTPDDAAEHVTATILAHLELRAQISAFYVRGILQTMIESGDLR